MKENIINREVILEHFERYLNDIIMIYDINSLSVQEIHSIFFDLNGFLVKKKCQVVKSKSKV